VQGTGKCVAQADEREAQENAHLRIKKATGLTDPLTREAQESSNIYILIFNKLHDVMQNVAI
jgi:hypothetical protein